MVRRLTNSSPPPSMGVGQKSSEAELIGSGSRSGALHGSSRPAREAIQMSSPVDAPARFDAM
jgi:hypothetical protein